MKSLLLAAGAGLLALEAVASPWRGVAGVSGGLVFTDNLFLSPVAPESDSILRVQPYVSLSRTANRVNASFNYGPVLQLYANNDDLGGAQHVLSASLNAELVETYFFVDVAAQANQVLIAPGRRTGFDAVANEGAFAQVASISVRPRLELPAVNGDFATVDIEPGFGTVFQASTADSNQGVATGFSESRISVRSGSMFQTFPWSVTWSNRVFDTEEDASFGSLQWSQSWVINRRYRLTGILGYDDSAFANAQGESSGSRWELRLDWTPKPTSQFSFGFGQAYYGDFFSASATHRHKRWVLNGNYQVSVGNALTSILEQTVVPLTDPFGEPLVNPFTGEVLAANITTPALVDDSFLQQQADLSITWRRGRTSATGGLTLTQREYSQANLDATDNQFRLTASRRVSPRLSANAGLRWWLHDEQSALAGDFTQDEFNLGLSWQVGPRTTVNTGIARQNRSGETTLDSFSEHRVSIGVSFQL